MKYRSRRPGGVPLCASLLLLLLGRAFVSGSSLSASESVPGSAAETTKGAGLIAKSPASDSVGDCILIQFGVLDKGESMYSSQGNTGCTDCGMRQLKASFNMCINDDDGVLLTSIYRVHSPGRQKKYQ